MSKIQTYLESTKIIRKGVEEDVLLNFQDERISRALINGCSHFSKLYWIPAGPNVDNPA